MTLPRRPLALMVVALLLAGALAHQLTRARRASSPATVVRGGVELEWRYTMQPERAADRRFQGSLDGLMQALRERGLRIGRVLPGARAATVSVPGLDEARLAQALVGLPLHAGPLGVATGEVQVTLDEAEAARVVARAARDTALQLRERVVAAHPCDACVPVVFERDGLLVVRLPVIDAITEHRVKAAIDAPPPLPAPLQLAAERLVNP